MTMKQEFDIKIYVDDEKELTPKDFARWLKMDIESRGHTGVSVSVTSMVDVRGSDEET